jgi:hypothetical protein
LQVFGSGGKADRFEKSTIESISIQITKRAVLERRQYGELDALSVCCVNQHTKLTTGL